MGIEKIIKAMGEKFVSLFRDPDGDGWQVTFLKGVLTERTEFKKTPRAALAEAIKNIWNPKKRNGKN
jgi:hypothetical protein